MPCEYIRYLSYLLRRSAQNCFPSQAFAIVDRLKKISRAKMRPRALLATLTSSDVDRCHGNQSYDIEAPSVSFP